MTYHVPVLLHESIDGLTIRPGGIYIDATFGGGGHSSAILQRIGSGTLYAFDQDDAARANIPADERIVFTHHNFRYIKRFMNFYGIESVDGILADLGVSSHHFDTAERGFSFRFDAELDMRMDNSLALSAKDILNTYTEQQLAFIFKQYGELKQSQALARTIVEIRGAKDIQTTEELKLLSKKFYNFKNEQKVLSQIFQALRIEVNQEMQALQEFLMAGLLLLAPGGRFVVITYHSLEDRMVKQFFKTGNIQGVEIKDFYGNVQTPFEHVHKKTITPSDSELQQNSRARSARLRIVEKR